MKLSLVFAASVFLLSACAPSEKLYDWGDHASTLYELRKFPGGKTLEEHRNELRLIMQKAEEEKRPVPPGVYAEYGYYLLKEGREAEGMPYLDKEAAAYPESALFIMRIKEDYAKGKQ